MWRSSRSRTTTTALLLSTAVAACDDPEQGPLGPQLSIAESSAVEPFDVYVQNVYLGGDTGPLFSLDFGNIPAVTAAANSFWNDVQASEPMARVAAIVDELERSRPHVVGLQEVLQFGVLDASFNPIGGLDFLAALEAEIAARGLPYVTEVVQPTTSSALPLELGLAGVERWLAFTDRVVALRRSDVPVSGTAQGTYAAFVPLGPLDFKRGWARISVEHDGSPYHFVTTHLEIQALAPIQALQTQELLNGVVAGLDGVTIIGGDLNSDAAGSPGDPSWTPTYGELLDAGFADVWALSAESRRSDGFTCCQDPSLSNESSVLDRRIDFVLVRNSDAPDEADRAPGAFRSHLVGEVSADRTEGVWPSDHAGLVASLKLPRGLR